MKHLPVILFFFISSICSAQNANTSCRREKGYSRHAYRKYAKIKTTKWEDVYFDNKLNLFFYKKDSTKKVTGYLGSTVNITYKRKGEDAKRLVYYDTCRTKIKEFHNIHYSIHIEFYENGKKHIKTIDRNHRKTKRITWDHKGKRHAEFLEKPGRQY